MRFTDAQGQSLDIVLTHALVAGWTGRDRAAVQQHIDELAELGVPAPSAVPLYYRVAVDLLTTAETIQVIGANTSGEVEPVVIADDDGLWLGLGSDHTDRDLETHSVALAKQICAKPLASTLWRLDQVAGHLDRLELRSWIRQTDTDWEPYQSGTLASLRPLPELIRGAPDATADGRLAPGTVMLCGTLGAEGGVRPAAAFRMELHDPVLDRTLRHQYTIESLPVAS